MHVLVAAKNARIWKLTKGEMKLENMNEVVKRLKELNSIVSSNGEWLNVQQFQEIAKKLPELLEYAQEAQANMKQLSDPDYPDQQLKLNYELEKGLSA